ncbi:MAG: hypothetical protein AAB588_06475 [Patescibacteria group bacterium]
MVQPCVKCANPFDIADEDLQFYENVSPVFGGQKYLIPPPTHCPDCRQQRRLASCNEQFLYRGQCGLCGKSTLTQYPPGTQPYFCRECWHSDDWDPCSFGRDVDFTRPFFEQFQELQKQVPAQALHIDGTSLNSEYIHYAGSSKNCYLIAHADFCDECYYGYGFKNDVSDDILNAAIECEVTHKLFKITPQELAFYRRQKIPLPRRHPDQRHLDRFHKRNKRQFWQRACAKCQQPIWTTYSPEQPETVYCEPCYMTQMYV